MRTQALVVAGMALLLCLIAVGSAAEESSVVTVDSTTDVADGDTSSISSLIAIPGADGFISLREAVEAANNTGGPDTIHFAIPIGDPGYMDSGVTGTWTIWLSALLPTLSDEGTVISGTSQAVWLGADANPDGPEIEVRGTSQADGSCFVVTGTLNTIHHLVINRCLASGVRIYGNGATGNTVSGNTIGLDPTGLVSHGNVDDGILIHVGAAGNTVGGSAEGDRNLISGNGRNGIWIAGDGADGNIVSGNYIGLDRTGSAELGNRGGGIFLSDDASLNTIGGTTEGERNVISGNDEGIAIWGSETTSNTVLGNYIGTDASGSLAVGNRFRGIRISGGHDNTIGGTAGGSGNVISGNGMHGLYLAGSGVHHYLIAGNYIGTDAAGTKELPNMHGLYIIDGAHHITVGGDTPAEGNLISGNRGEGIYITGDGTVSNTVSANFIGTDADGTSPLPNGGHGVSILSSHNQVGGEAAGEGNLISGNGERGIILSGVGTMSNTITGNLIGTNISGTLPLGNTQDGVLIQGGAQHNVLGGDSPAGRNVVASNGGNGVYIFGSATAHNVVLGNHIGTDINGAADLGNGGDGVGIVSRAHDNVIGGSVEGQGNLISGNDSDGVAISNGATGNVVSGNIIGLDATGTFTLGNSYDGVHLLFDAQENRVGGVTPWERNIISGNDEAGVFIEGSETMSNTVSGNYIGTNAAGTGAAPNGDGVTLQSGACYNLIGGAGAGEGNLISGNRLEGVRLTGSDVTSNTVSGNDIGTTAGGSAPLPNEGNGVQIHDGARANTIGGTTPDERNVISGNDASGVDLVDGAQENAILGNHIGTDRAGTGMVPNALHGVSISSGAENNWIGGTAPGEGNLISGNGQDGIAISVPGTQGNTIAGNRIGTDVSGGFARANGSDGVHITYGSLDSQVGPANLIAFNAYNGVLVEGSSTRYNTITENSIHSNDLLGIDNAGGNTELPPPAIVTATSTLLEGTAPANSRVELFTGPDEEGRTYLTYATADGDGNWSVTLTFSSEGNVTATSTDSDGNTSEFSEAVRVGNFVFLPVVVRNH